MLAGIKEILIITTTSDLDQFKNLLGDGSNFGVRFSFATQDKPAGLAEAFIIGKQFLESSACALILGDNIFHGIQFGLELTKVITNSGAHIFVSEVSNPSQYGILTLNSNNLPTSIIEKPKNPTSNLAVTGLYLFDETVSDVAMRVKPSERGELEITSVIEHYLKNKTLRFTKLSRGSVWLDTGNPNSLHDAATYIRVLEERSGLKIACLEEIAFAKFWIDKPILNRSIVKYKGTSYGEYLSKLY
jgi:glucose-1-phosphate thymidylyltransferase